MSHILEGKFFLTLNGFPYYFQALVLGNAEIFFVCLFLFFTVFVMMALMTPRN